MEEPPKLLPSPANPVPAEDLDHDDNGFVNVEEEYGTISLNYHPDGKTNSVSRWSYEALLDYLAASTKDRLILYSISSPEHMEHIEKIVRMCNHFEQVTLINYPSPINQQIYKLLKMKSIQKENNRISVQFMREFDDVSAVYIDVESNGFKMDCQILDTEQIAYPHFLDYLKAVANKNNFVSITLDGVGFKDIFGELGWQYEGVMDENLSNGVATTICVMEDNNIYSLEYWDQFCRRLDEEDNRKSEEKEMESRANLWYQMIQ